jgi:hypothetical protein
MMDDLSSQAQRAVPAVRGAASLAHPLIFSTLDSVINQDHAT